MLEMILGLAGQQETAVGRLGYLREWAQAVTLKTAFSGVEGGCGLSFVAGTALRLIHGTNRYSEDLDFSLERPEFLDLNKWRKVALREFKMLGVDAEFSWKNEHKTIQVGWVHLRNVLEPLQLGQKGSVLRVKIEIDRNPPAGANREVSHIQSYRELILRHDDLPSLFAGKLHALLFRKYTKGRDWYDLGWYLRKGVNPNDTLLRNAALQSRESVLPNQWKEMLMQKILDGGSRCRFPKIRHRCRRTKAQLFGTT